MTKFSKTLVVVTFVLSVAFAAFGGSMLVGGINWQAEANKVKGYSFERKSSEGQPDTWDVKEHVSKETISGGVPHLAKAVTAARRDLRKRQEDKIKELTDASSKLETLITEAKEFLPVDKNSVSISKDFLTEELNLSKKSSLDISKELVGLSKQILAVRNELRNRREDIHRLGHLVKVIKTDQERINSQKFLTEKQITALNAQIGSLMQRREQLKKQLQ